MLIGAQRSKLRVLLVIFEGIASLEDLRSAVELRTHGTIMITNSDGLCRHLQGVGIFGRITSR